MALRSVFQFKIENKHRDKFVKLSNSISRDNSKFDLEDGEQAKQVQKLK